MAPVSPRSWIFTVVGMDTTTAPWDSPTFETMPSWAAPVPLAARAEGATKRYGKGDTTVLALDDVTVGLPAGRFTAIMGPSGSGKSTLMHCLAGLDTLTAGKVYLNTPGGEIDLGLAQRPPAHQGPPRADRLHLPGVQPAADACPPARTSNCR